MKFDREAFLAQGRIDNINSIADLEREDRVLSKTATFRASDAVNYEYLAKRQRVFIEQSEATLLLAKEYLELLEHKVCHK